MCVCVCVTHIKVFHVEIKHYHMTLRLKMIERHEPKVVYILSNVMLWRSKQRRVYSMASSWALHAKTRDFKILLLSYER